MDLQSSDWIAINQALHCLYRELDSQKHTKVMLEVLHELVPGESLALNIVRQMSPYQMDAVIYPEDHTAPEQLALIEKYSNQSPFLSYYASTVDASWKTITDFIPEEEFHKTELYRLGLGPVGARYQIFGALGFVDGVGYGLVINRSDRGFTEREREILNTVQPHLVTSFINAAVHSRTQNSVAKIAAAMESVPGAFGFFDAEGRPAWLQERAKVWLREFFAGEVLTTDGVPQTVRHLVAESAQAGCIPKTIEKTKGNERLIVCMGASPIGGWILRLDRKPTTLPPHFRPVPQLSQRENDVLKWMVEGKRNGEIATILGLSARTVENHVQGILKKLMVENRATAIVRAMEYCAAASLGLPQTAAKAG